jgi:hypothetical protein
MYAYRFWCGLLWTQPVMYCEQTIETSRLPWRPGFNTQGGSTPESGGEYRVRE